MRFNGGMPSFGILEITAMVLFLGVIAALIAGVVLLAVKISGRR